MCQHLLFPPNLTLGGILITAYSNKNIFHQVFMSNFSEYDYNPLAVNKFEQIIGYTHFWGTSKNWGLDPK